VAARGALHAIALLLVAATVLRIRHNPFYAYLESAVIEWLDKAEAPSSGRSKAE